MRVLDLTHTIRPSGGWYFRSFVLKKRTRHKKR